MPSLLEPLKTMQTGNADLDRVQQNVRQAIDPLKKIEILDGVLVSGVVLATGSNDIGHGLGRKPRGWIVVQKSAPVDLSGSINASAIPERVLTLTASAAATVALWVF